ncbi:4Fe-4S dicluster domain-containing protein [Mangrovimicrobium sediminis]|nr:4Fe-4S dicluster domain-containing protein [Haliea sp. SAOS-164]
MTAATQSTGLAETAAGYVKQHLIDPATCARCGSCEIVCPEEAIQMSEDGQYFGIDPERCTGEHECLHSCSTDAILSWRMVPEGQLYSLEEQFTWEELPAELEVDGHAVPMALDEEEAGLGNPAPASASTATTFLYTQHDPVTARIVSNRRVTSADAETDIHHIVLDFGDNPYPWLEGQNVGVLPLGLDPHGHPHHMRAYSIASDRDGERAGSREMALTVKRLVDEWDGKPYHGVASNFLCDLEEGAEVRCIGPMGDKFLMPQDPQAQVLMICTGTGIAPMRGFIQRQQRMDPTPRQPLQLFYGGRTPGEMAYYDELLALPSTLLRTHMALSRSAEQPRQYVQDVLREQSGVVASVLADDQGYIFICGLISMEQSVIEVMADIAREHGLPADDLQHRLMQAGRLHIETY